MSLPKVESYNYYIQAKGYFDKAGYKEYIKTEHTYDTSVEDKSIFFRACPFVKQGAGCTLPEKFRSYVCNFFICSEIRRKAVKYSEFKNYISECKNYARFIAWENYSLQEFFTEKKLNLADNFDKVISILKNMPFMEYEFGSLKPIVVIS